MPSQTLSPSHTPTRQSPKKQEGDLVHLGSWASSEICARPEATIDANDLLSPSGNGTQRSSHTANSHHLQDRAHNTPNRQSNQTNAVNSDNSAGNSNSYCLAADTLSSCQDGPSQLELWTQEYQRLENLAYRLARAY
jgi:hypothetical protein